MKNPSIIKKLIEHKYSQDDLYCGKIVIIEHKNGQRTIKVLKDFAIFSASSPYADIPPKYFFSLSNTMYRAYNYHSLTHEYCAYNPIPFKQYFCDLLKDKNISSKHRLPKHLLIELETSENQKNNLSKLTLQ